MKKQLLALLIPLMLGASCQENHGSVVVDTQIDMSILDNNGPDLLNPENPGAMD